jgi:hypothetical protein
MSLIAELSYEETINKPKHPKKGGIQGNNWEDPLSKKTMTHLRGGRKSWGSLFVVCLGLVYLTLFFFTHLLVSDYLPKILDILELLFTSYSILV